MTKVEELKEKAIEELISKLGSEEGNEYRVYCDAHKEWWIEHKELRSGEPLKQYLMELDLESFEQAVREEEMYKNRQELKNMSEMIRELSLVDKLLYGNNPLVKVKESCYDECADYLESLANGDKSVIEKLTQPTKEK